MIRDEGTSDFQKLFYNKKGPFAHRQRVMNVITEQYKVKQNSKTIQFPQEFIEQRHKEAEDMIKQEGGSSKTINEFDYD